MKSTASAQSPTTFSWMAGATSTVWMAGMHIVRQLIRLPSRILTTTAPAEFGGTNGGITTIITRSGTNDFHGTLHEFFREGVGDFVPLMIASQ
jgi:hypothetical protein